MNVRLRNKYKIETQMCPEDVRKIIGDNLGSIWSFSGDEPFGGKIKGYTFKIAPRNALRNAFRPTLHGRIYENKSGGSIVMVDARTQPFIQVFSVVWVLGVCFFLINGIITGVKPLIFIALFFFLFYFILSRLAFHCVEKDSRKQLKSLLKHE